MLNPHALIPTVLAALQAKLSDSRMNSVPGFLYTRSRIM